LGHFDRLGIFSDPLRTAAYEDNFERFLSFQIVVVNLIVQRRESKYLIICYVYKIALIPYMLTKVHCFQAMKHVPSVLTVHNGEYQGEVNHGYQEMIPEFDNINAGLLDWNNRLNPLATGLKTCWRITTVSPSYMEELSYDSDGLEWLFETEQPKSKGIINGIDTEVWN